jgi:hypothetical protein
MFIEILLVLAVVMFLFFTVSKLYFKRPVISKEVQNFIAESGVDTTNYESIITSTKNKVEQIQDKHFEDLGRIEESGKIE